MVMPISPNAMDNLNQNYSKGIFSSNPEQEKKLAAYFFWLRDNFNTLSKSQKSDYNILKLKQNFAIIKAKDPKNLTADERDFLRKYGVTAFGDSPNAGDRLSEQMGLSSANVNIVSSKEDLPRPAMSSQGVSGVLTKVGKEAGFKGNQDVYKYQDNVTGQTSYYYVVKDIQRFSEAESQYSSSLGRYQKLSEVVRKDPKPPSGLPGTITGTTGAAKTTPVKYVKLWYSADYKTLYENEIKRQVLELLNIPDMVLANYNWETIDSLQDASGSAFYENGELIYEQYYEPDTKIQSSISPEAANLVYKIQANINPLQVSLDKYRSEESEILSNFGFHKKGKNELVPLFPAYRADGSPRYDLEMSFDDAEEVLGYTVYLVEEDGII